MRLIIPCALGLWIGTTLLLSRLRWFARAPLVERLRPYAPGGFVGSRRKGMLSVDSFRDVIAPLAGSVGERLARALGVNEELAVRLERVHSPLDATAFRVRQLGWSVAAFGVGALIVAAMQPPLVIGLLFCLGAPLLAFMLVEQKLANESAAWQRRIFLELPVVAEQLAMLLSAGYSLGAALNRIAARGQGACAADLARVCGRIRQGLSEPEALREWALTVRVDALDRLIPVLALNREATDLGRLVSEEARSIRREAQRRLIETMEKREQQVWVPVTVATLLPGVIFMTIPFIEALRIFGGSS